MSYDHYQETKALIIQLKEASLENLAERLETAMAEGATGTEIFMRLRFAIDAMLPGISGHRHIKAKAQEIRKALDTSLKA